MQAYGLGLHRLQLRILLRGLLTLRPGGRCVCVSRAARPCHTCQPRPRWRPAVCHLARRQSRTTADGVRNRKPSQHVADKYTSCGTMPAAFSMDG